MYLPSKLDFALVCELPDWTMPEALRSDCGAAGDELAKLLFAYGPDGTLPIVLHGMHDEAGRRVTVNDAPLFDNRPARLRTWGTVE
jgi:hypothetical protein